MDYKIDILLPEDAGDGLPNMRFRLRVILASTLAGLAAWAAVVFLL
jgi:hypothetical protein